MRVLGCHKPADSPPATSVQMDASCPAAVSQMGARFEEGLMFWQDRYEGRPGCGMLVLAGQGNCAHGLTRVAVAFWSCRLQRTSV
jgi:hypothetical protein